MPPEKDYHYTGYNSKHKEIAKQLRKNMTSQEKHLWYDFLRTHPVKFYRQRVVDRFIVDFYCAKVKLVIELDGSQHFEENALEYDAERTEILKRYGITVIRFTNNEVDKNFSGVCEMIDQMLSCLSEEPQSLPLQKGSPERGAGTPQA